MALVIRPIVRPSVLGGLANGRIPPEHLRQLKGAARGCKLIVPAARAWDAMVTAAHAAGVTLDPFWPANAYRPHAVQERIFQERYRSEKTIEGLTLKSQGRPSRVWNEVRWYQVPGTAVAAVPGTSNHGWGLAIDVNNVDEGGRLAWLKANQERYGFSHELQSEAWHIRYVAGDTIPEAVLAYEAGTTEDHDTDPLVEEDDMPRTEYVMTALDGDGGRPAGYACTWGEPIEIVNGAPQVPFVGGVFDVKYYAPGKALIVTKVGPGDLHTYHVDTVVAGP